MQWVGKFAFTETFLGHSYFSSVPFLIAQVHEQYGETGVERSETARKFTLQILSPAIL